MKTPDANAWRHCNGSAVYVDDIRWVRDPLVAYPVVSPHAHADILEVDTVSASGLAGVHAVLLADAIPGSPAIGAVTADEALLAHDRVHYCGQIVALVVGDAPDTARAGAEAVCVRYRQLDAVLDIEAAIAAGSFHGTPHRIRRGDVDHPLDRAPLRIRGTVHSQGQDHFYLETHAALAIPGEGGEMTVYASTQHPTGVQTTVAAVLGIPRHLVRCEVTRVGGGFGGKETQAQGYAALAALAAQHTGRPVKLRLDREQDMSQTGKRHPFRSHYDAGFHSDGRLLALRVRAYSDGGWSTDLSEAVLDRALLHLDNAYHLPNVDFEGRVCRTNLPSNTAFRGFGGPQGMLVIERILDRAAQELDIEPSLLRRRNLYGDPSRNTTPYGQRFAADHLIRLWDELRSISSFTQRRSEIEAFNSDSRFIRRGIGITPVKFGISFTTASLNHGGAFLIVYADGSVQLNHGGVEMGQGLRDKMVTICAQGLGVTRDSVRPMPTSTDKIPNTPPTAASSGSDLNGAAVAQACGKIRSRLATVAAQLLGVEAASLKFAGGRVMSPGADGAHGGPHGGPQCSFADVAAQAWRQRVPLSAVGSYATPGIAYDRERGRGTPFHYFACGAAVAEVEVNGLTGEYALRRIDILHDVGKSVADEVDRGQIEGGFIQALGWISCEDVRFDDAGRLLTRGPSTYKIPTIGDVPTDFRVTFFDGPPSPAILGSKAVGEPPYMLALSVVSALHHAITSWDESATDLPPLALDLPCSPQAVLCAIEHRKVTSNPDASA
ncbi:MAG: xanthine dehydrogenase molybdopterin binding subunit [Nannocystaceae bacterium]